MTFTQRPTPSPIPIPLDYYISCNACLKTVKIGGYDELPDEWEEVLLPGWVGSFHSCCKECKDKLTSLKIKK